MKKTLLSLLIAVSFMASACGSSLTAQDNSKSEVDTVAETENTKTEIADAKSIETEETVSSKEEHTKTVIAEITPDPAIFAEQIIVEMDREILEKFVTGIPLLSAGT